jgi:hypothetical protein
MYKVNVTYVPNEQKLRSIKALRAIYTATLRVPLGLREAKSIADDALPVVPATLMETTSRVEADAAVAYLGVFGIIAEVSEQQAVVPMGLVQEIGVALRQAEQWTLYNRLSDALGG